jgi:TonB family protein
MESLPGDTKSRATAGVVSLVFHAVLLISLLWVGATSGTRVVQRVHPVRVSDLEFRGGTHAVKIVLPAAEFAAHTREPQKHADSAAKTILPVAQPQRLKKSGGGAPVVHHAGDGAGVEFGNGTDAQDMRPAFPVFSPRPPVTDRSLLPTQEKKIVVDVNVDEMGAVVSEVLVKGIGNNLDQLVLDTVKTWRFQPATVNGKAVPTQAELIFPFGPSYPITRS